jgi:hypothetical protein
MPIFPILTVSLATCYRQSITIRRGCAAPLTCLGQISISMLRRRLMIELGERRSAPGCADRSHVAVTGARHTAPAGVSHDPVRSDGASPLGEIPIFSSPEYLREMTLSKLGTLGTSMRFSTYSIST